jgi:threonine dehydrogenase-like Zn-dependent dehydrogenase
MFGMASVAMHDVKRSEIGLGDRALVVGARSVGLFTAQIARAAGAHVTICDLDPGRLEIAESVGVQSTVTIKDDSDWTRIRSTGLYDAVFEDSGAPVLDRIIGDDWGKGLITHRGKIIIIAGRFDVTYHFNTSQSHEATLLHASHFNQSDMRELCRLEDTFQVEPIIHDVVPIKQAHAIYDRLRDDPNSLL